MNINSMKSIALDRTLMDSYDAETNYRTKLIDFYLLYIVMTGVLVFAFMFVAGTTFPFNSFLAAFLGCIGCFIFGVNLRMVYTNKKDFEGISTERAFLEFVFCNIILFFVVLTFMG